MLPYAAAMYSNQLQQAAAMSYHQHQQQQLHAQQQQQGQQQSQAPSPNSQMQLAASLNLNMRYGLAPVPPNGGPPAHAYPSAGAVFPHAAALDPMALAAAAGFRHAFDPRTGRFLTPEEPKPQHSYIGLIAMAILSVGDKKMVLSDIYQWILDHYPYFRTRGPGWRNSIRHNLSLNDCFIKAGRSANGKGHYWAIHPANVEDFKRGDFRRRRAQRKVRKHMGLSVPDEEDDSDESPCTSPNAAAAALAAAAAANNFLLPPPGLGPMGSMIQLQNNAISLQTNAILASAKALRFPLDVTSAENEMKNLLCNRQAFDRRPEDRDRTPATNGEQRQHPIAPVKKRALFDVDSILGAPEDKKQAPNASSDDSGSESNGGQEKSPVGDSRSALAQPPFFLADNGNHLGNFQGGANFLAAAAAFMPFAFFPNFANGCPPQWAFGQHQSAAGHLASFLPPGQPAGPFWTHTNQPMANVSQASPSSHSTSPQPSKTSSNTPACDMPNADSPDDDEPMKAEERADSPDRCTPSPQNTAAQWQETFAKIMARSYQGRNTIKNHAVCKEEKRE